MHVQQLQGGAIMTAIPRLPELKLSHGPLTLEQLPLLIQLGHVENGFFILDRSLKGWKLKTTARFPVENLLSLGEKGLAEYIVKSLISQRPSLIPWVLENESLLELAKYMLRGCSGSLHGFYGYTNTVSIYCRSIDAGPDQLVTDVKPDGVHSDPDRIQKHQGFLQHCLNELQDKKRSSGRQQGYARHIRTFYRVNGIKLEPPLIQRERVVNRDRAPTSDELKKILDVADPREKTIVLLLSLGGFREGTLARLKYSHVKDDLERGILPVHVAVEADIVKGHYADYDTFLGEEAVNALRAYIEQRKRGSPDGKIPPETMTDDTPLVRDIHDSRKARPIGEKQIGKLVKNLYHKAGLTEPKNGCRLRVHSIRKWFRTELTALGAQPEYTEYMLGHRSSTYHDIRSKGIEFLRDIYNKADLRISKQPRESEYKRKFTTQILRSLGVNPENYLPQRQTRAEPHRIYAAPGDEENNELSVVVRALKDSILTELQGSLSFPGPPLVHREYGGPGEI
jgi:site-specific recombinase XerD